MSDSRGNGFKNLKNEKELFGWSAHTSLLDIQNEVTIAELHSLVKEYGEDFYTSFGVQVNDLPSLLKKIKFDSTLELTHFRELTPDQAKKEWGDYYEKPICKYMERTPEKLFKKMTLKEIHEFSFQCTSKSNFSERLECYDPTLRNFFSRLGLISNRTMDFGTFSSISRAKGANEFGSYYFKTAEEIMMLQPNQIPLKNNENRNPLSQEVSELLKFYLKSNNASSNRPPRQKAPSNHPPRHNVVISEASNSNPASNPTVNKDGVREITTQVINSQPYTGPLNPAIATFLSHHTLKRNSNGDIKSDINNAHSFSVPQEKNPAANKKSKQQMDSKSEMVAEKNTTQNTLIEEEKRNENEDEVKIHNRSWF